MKNIYQKGNIPLPKTGDKSWLYVRYANLIGR